MLKAYHLMLPLALQKYFTSYNNSLKNRFIFKHMLGQS